MILIPEPFTHPSSYPASSAASRSWKRAVTRRTCASSSWSPAACAAMSCRGRSGRGRVVSGERHGGNHHHGRRHQHRQPEAERELPHGSCCGLVRIAYSFPDETASTTRRGPTSASCDANAASWLDGASKTKKQISSSGTWIVRSKRTLVPVARQLLGGRARPPLARGALTCGSARKEGLDEVARHAIDARSAGTPWKRQNV